MYERYSTAAQQILHNPSEFRVRARGPLLLWEAGPLEGGEQPWMTNPGIGRARPSLSDPLLIEVRKRDIRSNGFGLGVTVGRTPNNDVLLDDPTVSRFHGYFAQAKSGVWHLVDAESQNGSYLGDHRLSPGKPVPLFESAELRFGDVRVTFFSLGAFEKYVRRKSEDADRIAALDRRFKPTL